MNKAIEQLEVAMRAKVGAIWIRSPEELRVERELAEVAANQGYRMMVWGVTNGLCEINSSTPVDQETRDPAKAIQWVMKASGRTLMLMRDAGAWLNEPMAGRVFKEAHRDLPTVGDGRKEEAKQIIVLDMAEPPKGLLGLTVLEWPLPDREVCSQIVDSFCEFADADAVKDLRENGNRDELLNAMLGLTAEDAACALSRALAATGRFDAATVRAEKSRLVKGAGLEWYEPDPRGLASVGGLGNLKAWLTRRAQAFTPEAAAWRLPALKGALLVGVPGCGKSLTAKAIAAAWGMPLLRLDVGALFGKYVGDSEERTRAALRTASAVSPCVLWIDELDKALGGGGGDSDGGTSSRVLGTLLTWMQERKPGVFVFATANDIGAFKRMPELLRAGRWDSLWFVDLPNLEERTEIARVMVERYPHCESVLAGSVAALSDTYTGAEIEQAFNDACYAAFDDGGRNVCTDDVKRALEALVPLSRTMKEQIEALRNWAQGRCRPASIVGPIKVTGGRGGRAIEK